MQQVVTLVEYSVPKTGQSQHGPWSLHVFKDAGGNKYQTFKDDVANVARGLMNTPVSVTYDVETRNYQDQQGQARQAQNNVLTSVEAANGQQTVGGFPAGQQAATAAPVAAQTAPAQSSDPRGTIINRSAALARAIEAHAAGIAVVQDPSQLAAVADLFVKYIETGSF
jgi:hypothetical protein